MRRRLGLRRGIWDRAFSRVRRECHRRGKSGRLGEELFRRQNRYFRQERQVRQVQQVRQV